MFKSKERYYTPHPPPPQPTPRQKNKKKRQKKDKKRGFTEAKHSKKGKNALSLWRQCSELAKTLFRDAAFCAPSQLLQRSSQAFKTFFQLLQIKRLQLKLTNTLQNSYPIQSQHQVPRTGVKQHPKTPQTTKTNENPSPSSSMHKLLPFGSKWVPTWFL